MVERGFKDTQLHVAAAARRRAHNVVSSPNSMSPFPAPCSLSSFTTLCRRPSQTPSPLCVMSTSTSAEEAFPRRYEPHASHWGGSPGGPHATVAARTTSKISST